MVGYGQGITTLLVVVCGVSTKDLLQARLRKL